jgi:uncharacterized protein YjiS (DUF1127 family)
MRNFVLAVTFDETGSAYVASMKFPGEGVMTKINLQTKRVATWLTSSTFRSELTDLSDRALEDTGLSRRQLNVEACKPFWMA